MAPLAETHPTLIDIGRRLDPDGSIAQVIEMMTQTNEMLTDMVMLEGNLPTGHQSTVRTGLPTATWRKLYGEVNPTKSTTAQVKDTCGMLETYAEIDVDAAKLNGNTAAWRLSEDRAFIEGLNQQAQTAVLYESEATNPERITGFDQRFNSQSAANAENILTSAATPDGSDNTSIWLVVWGPNTVHGIYPKGSQAGILVEDKGQQTKETANGMYEVYRTRYQWKLGLCVRDWRYVVRINYDLEDIVKDASTGPDLLTLMAKAIRRVPNLRMGRPAFYMNRDSWDAFDLQCNNRNTLGYTTTYDAQGIATDRFRSVPIRRCDAILSTESGI
jgi:hypothetical protein